MNNSDKNLEWSLDLKKCGKAIEEGIFRFVNANGAPFTAHVGSPGILKEKLLPGETFQLCVMFCPGKDSRCKIQDLRFIKISTCSQNG